MDISKTENNVVNVLPPHQLESSLVTESELHLAQQWGEAITPDDGGKLPGDTWLNQWLSTALPFSFRYDGKESNSILSQWQIQKKELSVDSGCDQKEIIWTDEATGLRLTWQVKRFLNYPAVEWLLTFENMGTSDTPIIEDIQALNLRLNHSSGTSRHSRGGRQPYTVHGVTGGRSLPDDMIPFSWQVPSADGKSEIQLGGGHPSSNRHLPFFNLETPAPPSSPPSTGGTRGVLVGVGWSGNWLAQVNVNGTELKACAGLKESHFILHPGEKVRTPRILLLFWEGKRLHGHNMLRQLLHKQYVPSLGDKLQEPPRLCRDVPLVSVNVCFTHHGRGGFLHQATEKEVLSLVQPFIKIGAELLIIDAGWYEGEPWHEWCGNWRFSKEKYPRGFRPISEPLSAANAAFGLWFASEGVSKTAPLVQEHSEWIRQPQPGSGGTLRMELPEAREWFLKQVDYLVEHEGMNCYRQDGSGWYGDEPPNRKGITESQHITGLYTLWDTLIKRHPNLVMEGCSGGGRRIDLETLSRFHWHQKSDRWYDSESDQCSLYGANLYLPGGVINIPTETVDDYGAWSSFVGQFCLGWHPFDENFPMELAMLQVERYKRIRPLLSGDFYPLTPCSLEEPWIGYQFHRVDLDKGFALLFRRPVAKSPLPPFGKGGIRGIYPVTDTFRLSLRGLEPQSRYRVHFERSNQDETLTGEELGKGIEVIISEEKGAELITYEAIK